MFAILNHTDYRFDEWIESGQMMKMIEILWSDDENDKNDENDCLDKKYYGK